MDVWVIAKLGIPGSYWSDDLGWVNYACADRFSTDQVKAFDLPMGGFWTKANETPLPDAVIAEFETLDTGSQTSVAARCNCLATGETLGQFEWFEIMPCRDMSDAPGQSDIQTCEAREAKLWTIYGRVMEGPAEYLAYAVHDAQDEQAAVSVAVTIRDASGKGFMVGDTAHGLMPREPETDFTTIAEWLTDAIHDDLPDLPDDWARADDFDTHPMAGLREAFVNHSDYAGIPETNQ